MIFFLGTKNVGFDGVHLASKFSDALPAFSCAKATSNLRSICVEINIFSPFPLLYFPIGNILLSTPLRIFCLVLKGLSSF